MPVDKRYQVFVSSTFSDLKDERKEVMQALLELKCIPAGMELFPAADDDQWTLIKRVIDDSDYYVVILAGRYGSVGEDGMGYTEMEYRYAVEKKKPILAFLKDNPGSLSFDVSETDGDRRKQLEAFRALVKKKHCKFWTNATDLGRKVISSLVNAFESNPADGWVRGNLVPTESGAKEMLRLKKRIEELEAAIADATTHAPQGTDTLMQGSDEFEIDIDFLVKDQNSVTSKYSASVSTTWDDIFAEISPLMMNEASEPQLVMALNDFASRLCEDSYMRTEQFKNCRLSRCIMDSDDFQTIKVQLRALGLIAQSNKKSRVGETWWTITPYGDSVMTNLRALHRDEGDGDNDEDSNGESNPLLESE